MIPIQNPKKGAKQSGPLFRPALCQIAGLAQLHSVRGPGYKVQEEMLTSFLHHAIEHQCCHDVKIALDTINWYKYKLYRDYIEYTCKQSSHITPTSWVSQQSQNEPTVGCHPTSMGFSMAPLHLPAERTTYSYYDCFFLLLLIVCYSYRLYSFFDFLCVFFSVWFTSQSRSEIVL